MYELIRVAERSYYIDCPSKIGIIKTGDDRVVLIDSGNSKDTGKKIKRILDENGWTLDAIYNTHSHGDHIGANNYLQKQTGCKIYAKGIEKDFTVHPILESLYIYGGYSPRELRSRFLLAEESGAEELCDGVLPDGVSMIPLPGHSFDMVGFLVDDGTAFIGDAYSSAQTLDKYGIGFIHDVRSYIETLRDIRNINARVFVPSHAEAVERVDEIADYNLRKTEEIIESILEFSIEPICFDELLKKLFDKYSLNLSFEQYALVGSTVRSYLAYLRNEERVDALFIDNRMLWKRK